MGELSGTPGPSVGASAIGPQPALTKNLALKGAVRTSGTSSYPRETRGTAHLQLRSRPSSIVVVALAGGVPRTAKSHRATQTNHGTRNRRRLRTARTRRRTPNLCAHCSLRPVPCQRGAVLSQARRILVGNRKAPSGPFQVPTGPGWDQETVRPRQGRAGRVPAPRRRRQGVGTHRRRQVRDFFAFSGPRTASGGGCAHRRRIQEPGRRAIGR